VIPVTGNPLETFQESHRVFKNALPEIKNPGSYAGVFRFI
jgi:hypothetical protein